MSSAAGPLARARIGALVLAATILVPVIVSTATYATLFSLPETDVETRFGFASLALGIGALASAIGVGGILAFTHARETDPILRLRILSILRACADGAAFGILFAPELLVWQVSAALTVVEVAFFMSLLRFAAHVLDEQGAAATARSTRQFVWLYSAARLSMLLVWAFPNEPLLSLSLRAIAPILDGVVAFVLLRAAGLFSGVFTPRATPPST